MIKAVRIALVSSALLCGSAGAVLAQWYPPGLDEHATYKIPGTDEFFTGRGDVLINLYPDAQQNNGSKQQSAKPETAQKVPHPAVVWRNASLGG
jgi:hypothetical protein